MASGKKNSSGGKAVEGLFKPIADLTELQAIDTTDGKVWTDRGSILVGGEGSWYRLDRQSVAAESLPSIVAPTTGTGRWFKVGAASSVIELTQIYVDTFIGDNANGNGSSAKPFKTLQPAIDLRMTAAYTDHDTIISVGGEEGNELGSVTTVMTDMGFRTYIVSRFHSSGYKSDPIEMDDLDVTDAEKGLIFIGVGVTGDITLRQTASNYCKVIFDTTFSKINNYTIYYTPDNFQRCQIIAENSTLELWDSVDENKVIEGGIILRNSVFQFGDGTHLSVRFDDLEAQNSKIYTQKVTDLDLDINFGSSEGQHNHEDLEIHFASNLTVSSSYDKPIALKLFNFGAGTVTWGANMPQRSVITEGRSRLAPTIVATVLDIDFCNKNDFKTTSEVAAATDFSVTVSNDTNADVATIDLFITNTVIITLPTGSIMSEDETRWVGTPTLQLTIDGGTGQSFELSLNKVGTKYKWVLSKKFI